MSLSAQMARNEAELRAYQLQAMAGMPKKNELQEWLNDVQKNWDKPPHERCVPSQLKQEVKAEYIGKPKEGNFMNEMFRDLRQFIKEHRGVFYTVALVAVADHFLLDGQFREKLKGIIAKLLSKAENALELKHEQKTN